MQKVIRTSKGRFLRCFNKHRSKFHSRYHCLLNCFSYSFISSPLKFIIFAQFSPMLSLLHLQECCTAIT